MKIADLRLLTLTLGVSLGAGTIACADDVGNEGGGNEDETTSLTGDGDGDGDPTGAEGQEAEGDGDGDPTTGDGDGDGDPTTGDGDGDPTTGDGDGDPTTGDGDGDGDPTTTTTTTGNNNGCQAPAAYTDCDGTPGNLTTNPFQAIGVNCGDDPTSTVVASTAVMNSNNANAWRIMTQFGTADQANGENRYGGKLWAANLAPWVNPDMEEIPNNTSTAILMLSTGVIAQPNAQGVVTEANAQGGNGDNQNDDSNTLPAPITPDEGSNNGNGGTPFMDCDGVNDCSDSLYDQWYNEGWNNPEDKLWMQMDLTVPVGTEGYVFDFAYFSSEYPTWVNTNYNDLFIAWSTSETYTGNITFVNDAPLTVTSLANGGGLQYTGQAPQLAGTGFSGNAGTGWYTARGSVAPEEDFQLTFFIADMGDSALATGVLLDNFRWECAGCIPSEVNSCGIAPQ